MDSIKLSDIVNLAMDVEERGARLYNALAQQYDDNRELSAIFTQLAKDENIHKARFRNILRKMDAEDVEIKGDTNYRFILATTLDDVFDKQSAENFSNLSVNDVLIKIIGFEKSTLLFYHGLKDIVGENEQLEQIIAEEKKHVDVLMKVLLNDAQFRGLSDRWV